MNNSTPARFFHTFGGGEEGTWLVERIHHLCGDGLPLVKRVSIFTSPEVDGSKGWSWTLRGVTSNERYVTRSEKNALGERPAPLGRREATRAALVPIRKSPAWWTMPQDERRAVMEDQSRHISTGLKYLPAIARRLYHCRDLGESEPFDFLTWFEYASTDEWAFDELLAFLRASEEWRYVDREVDLRLALDGSHS